MLLEVELNVRSQVRLGRPGGRCQWMGTEVKLAANGCGWKRQVPGDRCSFCTDAKSPVEVVAL